MRKIGPLYTLKEYIYIYIYIGRERLDCMGALRKMQIHLTFFGKRMSVGGEEWVKWVGGRFNIWTSGGGREGVMLLS